MNKIFLIIFLLLSYNSLAQFTPVISIIPPNPTTTDEILLVAQTTHANSPCWIELEFYDFTNNDLIVGVAFCTGTLTAICNRIDTFVLGIFPIGIYNLTFGQFNICDTTIPFTSASITFTVSPSTAITETTIINEAYIFPNPVLAGKNLTLQNNKTAILEVTDVNGKLIHQNLVSEFAEIPAPSSPGIYFFTLLYSDKVERLKVIVH